MTPILAVAAGSALGGVARYAVSLALAARSAEFPFATLCVNILGGFLIGLLVRVLATPASAGAAPTMTWLFLAVGFCGGFTTFSAFGLDVVRLLQVGTQARAALYVALSVGLTVAAVYAGMFAGRAAGRG